MSAYASDPRVMRVDDQCVLVNSRDGQRELYRRADGWVVVDMATARAETRAEFDAWLAGLPRHASVDAAIASVIGDPQ